MHHLLPIFKWFDGTWIGEVVRNSKWIFPAIEAVHIVALALLFGAILMLNLRLMRFAFKEKPTAQLAREMAPWIFCSLVVILVSGFLLFTSEAMKAYASSPFQIKMLFLFGAMIFHYTIYARLTRAREAAVRPIWNRTAAVVSILLWLGVGIGGRAIGFF